MAEIYNDKSNTIISGTSDDDTIRNGYYDEDTWYEGGSNFTTTGGSNITINGSAGNDSIINYDGNYVTISGDEGNDYIGNGTWIGENGDWEYYYGIFGSNSSINGGTGNDFVGNRGKNVTINGGDGDDTVVNVACIYNGKLQSADKTSINDGDGKDIIYGFDDTDMLEITGTFSTSYDSSKKEIYFKVGSTKKAITLKDFTATSFNINNENYKINGSKFVSA